MAVAGLRPSAQARPRATERSAAGARPVAPATRVAASPARAVGMVRPFSIHAGRALPHNAALVGRRTIAVAVHRPRTAALGIAAVATVLLAVLFYLSQTFQVAAARYELDTLATERDALLQELRSQDGVVMRWGSESYVGQWALGADLDLLGRAHRFGAR